MKLALRNLLMVAWLVSLSAACAPQTEAPTGNQRSSPMPADRPGLSLEDLTGITWTLQSYGPRETPVDPVAPATAIFENGRMRGSTGCNNYGARADIAGSSYSVSEIVQTEMACLENGVMEQESSFMRALASATTIQLEDDVLIIGYEGGELRFVPAAPTIPAPLTDTIWELQTIVEFQGDTVSASPVTTLSPVTAEFTNDHISGSGVCNSYGGPYQVEGANLQIGEFMRTTAECPDDRLAELESLFFAGLSRVETYVIAGDQLTLAFPDGELVFFAKPAIQDPQTLENDVYAVLLREWLGNSPDTTFVFRRDTAFNAPGVSLDATLQAVADQLGRALDATTLTHFRQRNEVAHSLPELLTALPNPVYFLAEAEIDEALAGEDGWEEFTNRFNFAPGIMTLSRIGFNEASDQALGYVGWQTANFTGGYYSLLAKEGGFWVSTQTFLAWESPPS